MPDRRRSNKDECRGGGRRGSAARTRRLYATAVAAVAISSQARRPYVDHTARGTPPHCTRTLAGHRFFIAIVTVVVVVVIIIIIIITVVIVIIVNTREHALVCVHDIVVKTSPRTRFVCIKKTRRNKKKLILKDRKIKSFVCIVSDDTCYARAYGRASSRPVHGFVFLL